MDFFWAKIVKKMEFKGQKLTYIKKRDISGQKKKLGLSLRTKKGLFLAKIVKKNWVLRPKINQFSKKKKGTFPAKKQAGAELKNNKRVFLGKNSDRNWVKRPQIDQFSKKKKMTFRAKKTSWGWA